MKEFEVKFKALYVRVMAETKEEAKQKAKPFAPEIPRMFGIVHTAAPIESVKVATDPIGTGSKAP